MPISIFSVNEVKYIALRMAKNSFAKKLAIFVGVISSCMISSFTATSTVLAAFDNSACQAAGIQVSSSNFKDTIVSGSNTNIDFSLSGLSPNTAYIISATHPLSQHTASTFEISGNSNSSGKLDLTLQIPDISDTNKLGIYKVSLGRSGLPTVCQMGSFNVSNTGKIQCKITISQKRVSDGKLCYAGANGTGCMESIDPVAIDVSVTKNGQPLAGAKIDVSIGNWFGWQQKETDANGKLPTAIFSPQEPGAYTVDASVDDFGPNSVRCNPAAFNIRESCIDTKTNAPLCETSDTPIDTSSPATTLEQTPFKLCSQITNPTLQQKCLDCAGGEEGKNGVWTAVGCIKRDPKSIVQRFVELGLGLGGGVCLLMTIAGGFLLTTSQGNPKQADEAKEMITSAVIGLLFIIFSVVILQFIGVTIFHIPGFGTA